MFSWASCFRTSPIQGGLVCKRRWPRIILMAGHCHTKLPANMQFRCLGRTGMNVSPLSIGSSALGGFYRDYDDEDGVRAIRAALDLGINFIDSSPFYGMGRAETVVGKALKRIPRDQYF